MRIKGFRAIYGDFKGAHDLLQAAPAVASEAAALTRFTDIPSQPPSKIIWQPFFRGLKFENHYVLIKTFHDENASRPGMVFSEAVFFPFDETIQTSNITPLIAVFSPTIVSAKKLNRDEFAISSARIDSSAAANERPPAGLITLLNELVESEDGDAPLVWLGQDSFLEIFAALWSRILPTQRENFAFRFCFVPQDFGSSRRPTLIYTLPELSSRWIGYRRIAPPDEKEEPKNKAVAFLLKDASSDDKEPLKAFLSKLGIEPTDWQSLRLSEQCVDYESKLEGGVITLSELRGLISRIAVLAPGKEQGSQYKKEVFPLFCKALVKEGAFDDFFAANRLNLAPFPEAEKLLRETIKDWLKKHLFALSAAQIKKAIARAVEIQNQIWGQTVFESLEKLGEALNKTTVGILWDWWQADEELFDLLSAYLPRDKQNGKIIYENCPRRLSGALGDKIRKFAVKEKSWRLYAVAASASLPPVEAVERHLAAEPADAAEATSGVPILFDRISTEEILKTFLQNERSEKLLPRLAEKAVASQKLLAQIDLRQKPWQKLAKAMLKTQETAFWKNVPSSRKILFGILDLKLSGDLGEVELLSYAAHIPSAPAGLLEYPERKRIWGHLPDEEREIFLERTAEEWWGVFIENQRAEQAEMPEPELKKHVLTESRIRRAIEKSVNPVDALLKIFAFFPELPERKFSDFLYFAVEKTRPVNQVTAIELGKFVRSYNAKDVARDVLRLVDRHGRNDLRPALEQCAEMFGIVETFWSSTLLNLRRTPLRWEDWEEAFDDCLIDLYRDGPSQSNLWKRAGGDSSVLLKHAVSGRDAWLDALQKLRRGGGGRKITTVRIIEEAKKDYPNNEKLALLEKLFYELGGSY